ncbi:hypothetical protein HERIO_842 [Hepatospora eriocheir]|uniref:Uncharacterized protein n=1 Tax=Hepatospora eriocheir TaxID=1081669 RepID=A0A1X0QBX3_9MICR|nr:hypothetical protein HERIO_842 [Hepatospora eriocheir]
MALFGQDNKEEDNKVQVGIEEELKEKNIDPDLTAKELEVKQLENVLQIKKKKKGINFKKVLIASLIAAILIVGLSLFWIKYKKDLKDDDPNVKAWAEKFENFLKKFTKILIGVFFTIGVMAVIGALLYYFLKKDLSKQEEDSNKINEDEVNMITNDNV